MGFIPIGPPSRLSQLDARAEYQEGAVAKGAAVPGRWPPIPLLHNGIPPLPEQYSEFALPSFLVIEVFGLFVDEVREGDAAVGVVIINNIP